MEVETLFTLSNLTSLVGVVIAAIASYQSWDISSKVSDLKDQESEKEIKSLKSQLNSAAQDAKGFALGVGEVCVEEILVDHMIVRLMIRNLSTKYPCLNIKYNYVNLNSTEDIIQQTQNPAYHGTLVELGPSNGKFLFQFDMTNADEQGFNLFMHFKNNQGLTYCLRVVKIDGVLKFASKHLGDVINKTEIPNDFPGLDPANPDQIFQ